MASVSANVTYTSDNKTIQVELQGNSKCFLQPCCTVIAFMQCNLCFTVK